jgi:large subunit ribosomal protein L21
MKKAVIQAGGKQYLVSEGQELQVELIKDAAKSLSFKPLLVIDDQKISVGKPEVEASQVSAQLLEADKQADKVTSIRFEAKKRVHKVRGHRQRYSTIKISKIN